MNNPWFRMYAEFSNDPKVQAMSEAMQRRLVMLFCLRCGNVIETFHETEVTEMLCFTLRISAEELEKTKELFIKKGFIDANWNLLNWNRRQFVSDSSTGRVREYRERMKELQKNQEKPNETEVKRFSNAIDTDTDTEKNISFITEDNKLSPVINSPPSQGDGDGKEVFASKEGKTFRFRKRKPYCPEFEKFLDAYGPNGSSATETEKAYKKAISEGATHQEILAAVIPYKAYLVRSGIGFAYAATWLRKKAWESPYDSLAVEKKNGKNGDDGPKIDHSKTACECGKHFGIGIFTPEKRAETYAWYRDRYKQGYTSQNQEWLEGYELRHGPQQPPKRGRDGI